MVMYNTAPALSRPVIFLPLDFNLIDNLTCYICIVLHTTYTSCKPARKLEGHVNV